MTIAGTFHLEPAAEFIPIQGLPRAMLYRFSNTGTDVLHVNDIPVPAGNSLDLWAAKFRLWSPGGSLGTKGSFELLAAN